jgi:RNA-binding protein YhbY
MSNSTFAKFQIGKSGVTSGVVDSLKLALKNHNSVRISVLKSTGRTRDSIKKTAEEIAEKLGFPSRHKIIGFTIILKKTRK